MQESELKELVQDIQRLQMEKQTIECKAAAKGCPKRLFDTLSSFSNQDEGGIILFGVDEADRYALVDVYDPQDLQKKVNEQCKQMEPAVRPLFTVVEIDGCRIVSAEIPGVDISSRPVFYKGVGRVKGSYVRVGDADELMSEYEVYSYDAFRKRIRDELRTVDEGNARIPVYYEEEALEDYYEKVRREHPKLLERLDEEQLREMMGITCGDVLTIAGAMVFSVFPQAYFPQLCITAVALPGNEMGELGEDQERFLDNQRIDGTIPQMLEAAVAFVRKNSREKTIIGEDGKRHDQEEYPLVAVREAVLNALVHRDYSRHTENVPVRIEMYRNRMEIKSSGGLYGSLTIDRLGKVRPDTRNSALANILEVMKVTENRYSGIPTIRKAFRKAGLPEPEFAVQHGEFIVTFWNGYGGYDYEDHQTMPALLREAGVPYGTSAVRKIKKADMDQVVSFCKRPKSREEIADFCGITQAYVMTKYVQPLLEQGRLQMTMPEKPRSSKQRYFAALRNCQEVN